MVNILKEVAKVAAAVVTDGASTALAAEAGIAEEVVGGAKEVINAAQKVKQVIPGHNRGEPEYDHAAAVQRGREFLQNFPNPMTEGQQYRAGLGQLEQTDVDSRAVQPLTDASGAGGGGGGAEADVSVSASGQQGPGVTGNQDVDMQVADDFGGHMVGHDGQVGVEHDSDGIVDGVPAAYETGDGLKALQEMGLPKDAGLKEVAAMFGQTLKELQNTTAKVTNLESKLNNAERKPEVEAKKPKTMAGTMFGQYRDLMTNFSAAQLSMQGHDMKTLLNGKEPGVAGSILQGAGYVKMGLDYVAPKASHLLNKAVNLYMIGTALTKGLTEYMGRGAAPEVGGVER